MSYGINVYNSSGTVILNDSDTLWRYYDSYSVTLSGGTQTGTIFVNGISDDGNWCAFVTGSVLFFRYKITANTITYSAVLPTIGTYTISFNVLRKAGPASGSTYGLASYAISGSVQIDSTYDNYVLIAADNGIAPGITNAVSLPSGYTTNNCLILVRPTSSTGAITGGGPYFVTNTDPPDNTRIWVGAAFNSPITTLGTGGGLIINTAPTASTGTWDYRVYARASLAATNPGSLPAYNTGYGLNVFDSFANNVFSSNRTPPIVNQFYTQTYTPGNLGNVVDTYSISPARLGFKTYIAYRSLNLNEEQYGFGMPPSPPFGRVVANVYCNWNSSTQVQVGGGQIVQFAAAPATVFGPGYMTHVFMDSL